MIDSAVQSHIRAVREAHQLLLPDLATPMGLHPAHLSRIERGMRDLKVSQLVKAARRLACHPWDLVTFDGFPAPTTCPCQHHTEEVPA